MSSTSDEKEYVLQKDIVIPKGTRFDNFYKAAKEEGYFETCVGIGKDCAEFFRINDMDEILQHESSFFKIVNHNK